MGRIIDKYEQDDGSPTLASIINARQWTPDWQCTIIEEEQMIPQNELGLLDEPFAGDAVQFFLKNRQTGEFEHYAAIVADKMESKSGAKANLMTAIVRWESGEEMPLLENEILEGEACRKLSGWADGDQVEFVWAEAETVGADGVSKPILTGVAERLPKTDENDDKEVVQVRLTKVTEKGEGGAERMDMEFYTVGLQRVWPAKVGDEGQRDLLYWKNSEHET